MGMSTIEPREEGALLDVDALRGTVTRPRAGGADGDGGPAEVQLVGEVAREQTLARVLAPAVPDYDYVLIDCQPSLGLLTVNALTAADAVIIPLECEFFSLRGVALLIDTIEKIRERLNPRLDITGIQATMFDSRTLHSREVMARVVEAFGETVLDRKSVV